MSALRAPGSASVATSIIANLASGQSLAVGRQVLWPSKTQEVGSGGYPFTIENILDTLKSVLPPSASTLTILNPKVGPPRWYVQPSRLCLRPRAQRLRLPRRRGVHQHRQFDQGHTVYYRATKSDCSSCSLKPKCTTAVARKITRDLNEDVRDRVRALANMEAFQQSRRERKKVEMRFAHMKRILRLDRLGCEA